MKKNLSKFILVIMIGIISLNLIFAGSISKIYRINGDLVINSNLQSICISGNDWNSTYTFSDENPNNLNKLLDKIFFAESGSQSGIGCNLEIWSFNNQKIYEQKNLNANAIKFGLNEGIIVDNVVIDVLEDTLNFIIKITKQNNTLIETIVEIPNINKNIKISSDEIDAPIQDNFNVSVSPVPMLIKDGTSYYTIWKRISGDNILPKAITADKLFISNGSNGNRNNWVLSLSNGISMKWSLISGENIEDKAIQMKHLSDNIIQELDAKVLKIIHDTNKNLTTKEVIKDTDGKIISISDRDNKYFKILINDDEGNTTTYLLPVFILDSENPILNFSNSVVNQMVTGNTYVDAIINDLKQNITKTVSNNDYNYISVSDPTIITIGNVKKARVNVFCNNYTPDNVTLPKVTISGYSINNNVLIQDSFDVNCTANTNSELYITSTGSQLIINRLSQIYAYGEYVRNVNWSIIAGSSLVINSTQSLGDNVYKANVKCNSIGNNKLQVSAERLIGGDITDYINIECVNSSGGNGGGTCFKEGTKIYTTNGWKNIELITTDDVVYSYLENNKLVETKVKALLIHGYVRDEDNSVELILSNGKKLFVTNNHAFYSPDDLKYKSLKEYNIGDNLLYYNVEKNNFEKLKINNIITLKSFDVSYNLALENPNNYLAEGVVVHNEHKGGFDPIDPNPPNFGGVQH